MTIQFKNQTYIVIKTYKFKTSFGWAGSDGIEVKTEDGRSLGRYKNLSEFKKYNK